MEKFEAGRGRVSQMMNKVNSQERFKNEFKDRKGIFVEFEQDEQGVAMMANLNATSIQMHHLAKQLVIAIAEHSQVDTDTVFKALSLDIKGQL